MRVGSTPELSSLAPNQDLTIEKAASRSSLSS
jgi:hypothetical protein